jgi:hypothetical protein
MCSARNLSADLDAGGKRDFKELAFLGLEIE